MSNDHVNKVSGLSSDASIRKAKQAEKMQKIARMGARQVGSEENIKQSQRADDL